MQWGPALKGWVSTRTRATSTLFFFGEAWHHFLFNLFSNVGLADLDRNMGLPDYRNITRPNTQKSIYN